MELRTFVSYIFLISSGNLLVNSHRTFGYNFGNTQPLQFANTQQYTLGNSGFGGGSINLGGGRFQPTSSFDSNIDTSSFGHNFNYGSSLNNPFGSSLGQQRTITSFNHGLQGINNFAPRTLNSGFNSFNTKFTTPTTFNYGSLNSGFDSSAFNLGAFSGASNIESSQLNSDCVHNTGFDSGSLNLDSLKTVSNVDSGFNTGANLGSFDSKTSFDFGSLNAKPELSHTTFNSESFNLGSLNTPHLDTSIKKTSNFGNTKTGNTDSFNFGSLNSQVHTKLDSTHSQFPTINFDLGSLKDYKFDSVNTGFDTSIFNSGSLKTNVGSSNIGVLNTKAEFPSIETGSFDLGSLHHSNPFSGSTGTVKPGKTESYKTGVSNLGTYNSGYHTGSNVDFNSGSLGAQNTGSNVDFNAGNFGVQNTGSNTNFNTGTGLYNSGYNTGSNVDFNSGSFGVQNTGSNVDFNAGSLGVQNTGSNVDFNTGSYGIENTGVSNFGSFNTQSNIGSNTGFQAANNFDFNQNSGYNSGFQQTGIHQTEPHKESLSTQNNYQGSTNPTDPGYLPPFTHTQHQGNEQATYIPPQPSNVYGTPSPSISSFQKTGKLTGSVGLPNSLSHKGDNYPGTYPQTKLTLPKETPGSFNFGFVEKKEQTKKVESNQHTSNGSQNTLGGGILDFRSGEIGGEWNSTSNNI